MNYQACLWWTLDNPCNLDCHYCCARRVDPQNKPIDTAALLRTLQHTGRTFRLQFTSIGEPFLTPGIVDALVEITRHHYVSFNTNLTARCVPDFTARISPDRVVDIVASLHVTELERRGLTQRYIRNFHEIKNKGFVIRAQVVAHPQLLPRLDDIRDYFSRHGISFTCNHFIGVHNGKTYPAAYSDEQLSGFGSDISVGRGWRRQFGEPCNAGFNIAVVRQDGTVTRCYDVAEKLGHVYERIDFGRAIETCPSQVCSCALNKMDDHLAAMGHGLVSSPAGMS